MRWLSLFVVIWIGLPEASLAHNLRVFATAEGAWIQGQVYFAGGAAATARVLIYDQQQHLVTEQSTDAQGAFRWRAEAPQDYRVVAETGDGHRAEWMITAAELVGALRHTAASEQAAPHTCLSDGAREAQLEQALARQLRPLREQLARAEDRLLLRDLLGGIGWIFGVAGLALWWRQRRR